MSQLNLFEQEQKERFKSFKSKFYAGVREKFEKERRDKNNTSTAHISILYGATPMREFLDKARKRRNKLKL